MAAWPVKKRERLRHWRGGWVSGDGEEMLG